MSEAAKTCVIVEDEYLISADLARLCNKFGVEVLGDAASVEEAYDILGTTEPDYVLMDVRLGGKRDGVDVAEWMHARRPDTRIIYVTGSNEPPIMERIRADHPHRVLIKPVAPKSLREAFGLTA